jgi:outer membrane protein TolC
VTYANPNQRFIPPTAKWNASWDIGVRMSWTINDLGTSRSTADVTETEMMKIEAQKKQLIDSLRTEVLSAHRTIEEARLAKESANRGLAAAEASHKDISELFQHGRATTLDLLQAETALVGSRIDLIDAYVALRQAEVRLEHAVGRDIRDEPQSDASAQAKN